MKIEVKDGRCRFDVASNGKIFCPLKKVWISTCDSNSFLGEDTADHSFCFILNTHDNDCKITDIENGEIEI